MRYDADTMSIKNPPVDIFLDKRDSKNPVQECKPSTPVKIVELKHSLPIRLIKGEIVYE